MRCCLRGVGSKEGGEGKLQPEGNIREKNKKQNIKSIGGLVLLYIVKRGGKTKWKITKKKL